MDLKEIGCGIHFAMATALALGVPFLYAKKKAAVALNVFLLHRRQEKPQTETAPQAAQTA